MEERFYPKEKSWIKRLVLHGFWISLLLHVLLLLSFTFVLFSHPEENKKPPNLYVPSYVYKGAIKPSVTKSQPMQAQRTEHKAAPSPKTDENNFKPAKEGLHQQKSILSASFDFLRQNQLRQASAPQDEDPIYLIGDLNQAPDPLVRLMGKALSAHFEYPQLAGELGIKGRVLIGLTLHPEGHFSDVEILHSSNDRDLDAAALYAVNQAPLVAGADRFLTAPKHFVIGFIFQ